MAIDKMQLKLYKDQQFRQAIVGKDTDSIVKVGFKNGDMIYVANKET